MVTKILDFGSDSTINSNNYYHTPIVFQMFFPPSTQLIRNTMFILLSRCTDQLLFWINTKKTI